VASQAAVRTAVVEESAAQMVVEPRTHCDWPPVSLKWKEGALEQLKPNLRQAKGEARQLESRMGRKSPELLKAYKDVLDAWIGNGWLEAVDEERALGVIVGLTVAVLILELGEEGRVDEVEDAADEVAAAGALDLGVFDDLVGDAGALGVAGDQDAAHARDVAERAVLVRGDVDVAVGGGRHGGRVDLGLLGVAEELADDEPFRNGLGGRGEEEESKG
jgi:hypothetical protein